MLVQAARGGHHEGERVECECRGARSVAGRGHRPVGLGPHHSVSQMTSLTTCFEKREKGQDGGRGAQ